MTAKHFRTKFIVNPASANGSTGRLWDQLSREIRAKIGECDASFTTSSNHATELTRSALLEGYEMVVAVGGDGTVNEVVNGFFRSGSAINSDAALGVLSRGTGSDFIKTMKIPKETRGAVSALTGKTVKRCDVGYFTSNSIKGERLERYFINIADFGIGGEAVERVNNTTKAFGGFVSFLYGTIKTLLIYKGKKVKITIDDSFEVEKPINNVVVANGQYFGGGMWVAPNAQIDDGLFDILIMDEMKVRESLINISKLYKGNHLDHPKIECLRGKKVVAESSETVLIDVEGEHGGILPARFEMLPSAINVKVGE